MNVRFLDIAELELDEAIQHYEGEQAKLGFRFFEEVEQAISRIVAYPLAYQMLSAGTRRCLIETFPYGILYEYDESAHEILIVAIGHLHRKPGYWISRG